MALYDPFGLFGDDPFGTQTTAPAPTALPGQRQVPLLPPDEEDSLLSRVTGQALSGLGWVGGTLDKLTGGRAVRGLLGGRPEELLSLLPGSDYLGLTHQENAVSGEDLLKQWGALEGEGAKGEFELRDLAGPALEAVLSPATYLSFGGSALTQAGVDAAKAARLAPTLAERVAQGQAGLARLHIPFTDIGTTLGTGKTAQALAGKLSNAADWLSFGNPVGRAVGALFDADREGALTEPLQRANVAANQGRRAAEAAARQKAFGWGQRLADAGVLDQSDVLRGMLEGTGGIPSPLWGTQGEQALTDVAGEVRPYLDELLQKEKNLNIRGGDLVDDIVNYAPRQQTRLAKATAGFENAPGRTKPLSTTSANREDILKNIPGGTNQINQWFDPDHFLVREPMEQAAYEELLRKDADAKLAAAGGVPEPQDYVRFLGPNGETTFQSSNADFLNKQVALHQQAFPNDVRVLPDYAPPSNMVSRPMTEAERTVALGQDLGLDRGRLAALEAQPALSDVETKELAKLQGQADQASRLSKWIRDQDPQYASAGIDFFGNHILEDVMNRGVRSARMTANAKAIHGALAQAAEGEAAAGPGSKSLLDVLRDAGLGGGAAKAVRRGRPGDFAAQLLELARQHKVDLTGMSGKDMMQSLDSLHVSGSVARDMTRYIQGMSTPEALAPWLKGFDNITQLTKAGVTAVWPAKYSRDFAQGAFMNWIKDARDPGYSAMNPLSWTRPYEYAKTVLRDGGALDASVTSRIPGLAHLPPEEATQRLAQEMASWKVMEGNRVKDVGLGSGEAAGSKAFPLPNQAKEGLADWLKGLVPQNRAEMNPLNIGGVGRSTQTQFTLARQGGKAMEFIDDMNRGANYIAKRLQGFNPEAATRSVFEAHYDYSNLAPFEKSVMKRVMPFYSWMRQNIPATVSELAQKPGGAMAQAIRLTNALHQQQGFLPDYVGEGLAIPVGKEQNGTARYLGDLGLSFEDAFGDLAFGPKGGQRTLQNVLSNTNPMIKGILELAAGKQFYSGRNLEDLSRKGLTGNQLLDQAIMNSPLSRAATSLRTLGDERKGPGARALNLLTPAKIHDVDLDKARQIGGRDLVAELLKGNPQVKSFERLYVPDAQVGNLAPEAFELLRLYNTLEAQRQKKTQNIGLAP